VRGVAGAEVRCLIGAVIVIVVAFISHSEREEWMIKVELGDRLRDVDFSKSTQGCARGFNALTLSATQGNKSLKTTYNHVQLR
jgi:hypothetical protein